MKKRNNNNIYSFYNKHNHYINKSNDIEIDLSYLYNDNSNTYNNNTNYIKKKKKF